MATMTDSKAESSGAPNLFRTLGTKARLVDRVVEEIERLILEGRLPPGTKLPPEREFAEQLGVSRTVLREAVRILVTKGLLTTQHGVGTTVREMTSEQVTEPLQFFLRAQSPDGISFADLHLVRSILEVEIAALAASRATRVDIARLKEIVADMEAAEDNPALLAERDAEFHRALAEMSHNPLLMVLLDSIRDLLHQYIAEVTPYLDPRQDVLPQHRRIVERVEAGDAQGAREAMHAHMDQMRRNHEKYASRARQKAQ